MQAASERLNIFEGIFNSLIKRGLCCATIGWPGLVNNQRSPAEVVPAPSRGDLNASSLLVTADSFLPLRLFCKEPINKFHIAMHLLGSMNLFSDFAAVLEGL